MYFEKLTVWQHAVTLAENLYRYFRQSRDFGYKDQITRAGLSIPSNIAEGITRASPLEKRRFLNIAYSSCAELRTQIIIGARIDYIDSETAKKWIDETRQISSMLQALAAKFES